MLSKNLLISYYKITTIFYIDNKRWSQDVSSIEGAMYDGSNFAIVGGLVGMSAIICGIILLVATSKIKF